MRVLLLGEVQSSPVQGVNLTETEKGIEFDFNTPPNHQSEYIGMDGAAMPLETEALLAVMRGEKK